MGDCHSKNKVSVESELNKESIKNSGDELTQESTSNIGKEPVKESACDPSNIQVIKLAKEPIKEPMSGTVKVSAEYPSREPVKEPKSEFDSFLYKKINKKILVINYENKDYE